MSIISVKEEWKGDGGLDATADQYATTGKTSRRFIVRFDTDDPFWKRKILALTASHGGVSVPDYWDVIDASYPYWFVRSKRVSVYEGPCAFAVDVDYEYFDDPLSQPARVKWLFSTSNEPIDRDNADNPVANSADEPFDPPIQEEVADPVLQIIRNEAAYNPSTAHAYYTAVNNADWTPAVVGITFAANTAKCITFEGDEKRVGALTYYQVTREFQIRTDTVPGGGTLIGWSRRLRDQGFREKTGESDGKPVYAAITDAAGNPVSSPVPLDGAGRKLADGASPVFLTFDTKKTANFTALAL